MKKILNLEWVATGRDINMVEPVLTYLEKTKNYLVIRDSIHNALFKIFKYKPDFLIIADTRGANINFEINKLCSLLGIKVISFTCEGDFREDDDFETMFWGWNKDKIIYEDLLLVWSDRTLDLLKKNNSISSSELKNKVRVVGYSGIDKYFMKGIDLKSKLDLKSYKKIILITGFNFDTFGESWEKYKLQLKDTFPKKIIDHYDKVRVKFYRKSVKKVNEIYSQIINDHKNIFFLLKTHPGMINIRETEFDGIDFKNSKIIDNDFDISDIIKASDLLISFESTTCLESWLVNKPTLLLKFI